MSTKKTIKESGRIESGERESGGEGERRESRGGEEI
jgi:hypothetical protein